MDEDISTGPVAEQPDVVQEEYITAHPSATRAVDATPIQQEIITRARSGLPITHDLAAIQAVADTHIDDLAAAVHVGTTGDTEYYTVTATTFYTLAARVTEEYDSPSTIPVEQLQDIIDAHTVQFLADMHGYEGDFEGHAKTLSNAYNDPSPYEGPVRKETEPDDAHYGFVDARGLVVDRGTHTESSE